MGISLALHLALVVGLRTYKIPSANEHFQFSAEYGRIARWLVLGHGYASPMSLVSHSPTVIGSPFFPAYLALLFAIFGVYSEQSAAALLISNAVGAMLLIPLVHMLGRRLFGAPVGRVAAVLACFDPTLLWFSAFFTWETMLSCLVVTLVPALVLWVEEHPTVLRGAFAGFALGVVAHVNMTTLTLSAAVGAALLIASKDGRRALAPALAATAIVAALVCLPWSIRNTLVIGRPMLVRGGGEISLYVGNHSGATGDGFADAVRTDPSSNPAEARLYWQLGEREYFRYCRHRALAFILEHPIEYGRLVLQRFVAFWLGDFSPIPWGRDNRFDFVFHWLRFVSYLSPIVLAVIGGVVARRRGWRTWPLVVPTMVYSIPYVLIICGGHRHRAPIEGLLILLSSVALWSGYETVRGTRGRQMSE